MKLRDVLKDESCWTKWVYARTESGDPVSSRDPSAVKFCLNGARAAACNSPKLLMKIRQRLSRAVLKLFPQRYTSHLPLFNDHPDTTFADICSVIEESGVESILESQTNMTGGG